MTPLVPGTQHPLLHTVFRVADIFTEMGFTVVTGPEMETEWYNFDALNVAPDHPSRDMQDTFWIAERPGYVLRTHTTNVTARALEQAAKSDSLPAACVSVGKVFRNEATDVTHEVQFYQVDGAFVGRDVSVAHLKGVLQVFYRRLLNEPTIDRVLRPSYFPCVAP